MKFFNIFKFFFQKKPIETPNFLNRNQELYVLNWNLLVKVMQISGDSNVYESKYLSLKMTITDKIAKIS